MQGLRVAANHRYLEYDDGTPFFYLGDTAWEMLHRLTLDEARHYLTNRATKGFTVIQTVVLAELGGVSEPTPDGHLPLIDHDPARPNEAYFAHVDAVIEEAAALGLVVGLLPTWGSLWKQYLARPSIFDPDNAYSYGRFLGRRYAQEPVIWILGGDQNVESPEERAVIDAMAHGLREGDGGTHLITFHPRGPGQSSDALHDAEWLDFNMIQSSHGARDHDNGLFVDHDLSLEPLKPTIDGEPRYETIPVGFYNTDASPSDRFDDYDVRQAAYWAVMAGRAVTPTATTTSGRSGRPSTGPRFTPVCPGTRRSTIPAPSRWASCGVSSSRAPTRCWCLTPTTIRQAAAASSSTGRVTAAPRSEPHAPPTAASPSSTAPGASPSRCD